MQTTTAPYIVIVEDSQEVKEDLMSILASHGFLVSGFSSSQKALQFLRSAIIIPHLMITKDESTVWEEEFQRDEKLRSMAIIYRDAPLDIKKLIADILQIIHKQ